MIRSIFGETDRFLWSCRIASCNIGFWRIVSDYGWLKLTICPNFLCYLSGFIDAMRVDKGSEDKFGKFALIFDIYVIGYMCELAYGGNPVFGFLTFTLSFS